MFYTESRNYHQEKQISSFMWGVYGWMAAALTVTSYVAYAIALIPSFFYALHSNPVLLMLIFLAQIGLVLSLSVMLPRLSFGAALTLFVLYAASMGITMSSIFYIYTTGSIATTFLTSAGMFGAMALYGYVTKADLTTIGSMGMMVLFGLIIGMFVNIFLQNSAFDMFLSGVGVIVFALLTAYDVQKIKAIGSQLLIGQQEIAKITILCALTLYLDFINLFLFLLRFMGKKRD